jgi:hypothetical protein
MYAIRSLSSYGSTGKKFGVSNFKPVIWTNESFLICMKGLYPMSYLLASTKGSDTDLI